MNEETLFAEAIAIESPENRRKFLDEACGENLNLRKSVEKLLHLADNAGSFLEHPPVEAAADALAGIEPTIVYGNGSTYDDEGEAKHTEQLEMTQNLQEGDEISLGFLEPATREDSLGCLGHYEVLEVIGRGAFGIVLRAFDEKLQRVVAVKVLAPEMAAASPARKRFLREARTSAQIRHENVVAIYAVEDDPIPYLVMEYIPGKTLQQRLDEQGPLDLPDVLRLGRQIADGLAAAHAQGLIHRDIKPANILLEGGVDQRVKITDFGLARTADDASLTQSGVIAGTPMYMAPEQAHGHQLDQRADLFSFGSVLYQMLSGRPPFRAPTTMAVLKRVTEDTPRPLQEIIPETPAWMCELIGHLHTKNPEERYRSAREVSELLAQCADDLKAGRVPQIPDPSKSAEDAPADLSEIERRRSESLLQSPLVKLAAALVIMLGVLGITEATGVTKFASTVIRLTTGSGTLVIETDDPDVKIAINGEEVTITGGGVEELTLRPGEYKIAALKDGKPVKQELVTITRNGQTTVRMHLEPAAPPTPGSDRTPSDDPAILALLGASDEWEWSKPESLTAVNGAARDPCLALGDRLLLFASDRSGGLGRRDLWVSQRDSRSSPFSEPVNLGPTINTEDSEEMATMTEDGKILVFTSIRPGGVGGNDLWMSSRDSLEEPFSTPVNLGEPINSRRHDSMPDLSSDGLQLVFGSERDGQFQVFISRRTSRAEAFGPPVKLPEEVNLPGKRIWGPHLWQDAAVLLVRPDGLPISAAFWNSAQGKYGPLQPVAPPLDAGSAGTLSSDGREFYFQVATDNHEYELYRSRLVRKHPAADAPPPVIAAFTDADVERIAALPVAEQIEEVRKELLRRNPGFDGKVEHKIEDGVATELTFCTDYVTDISPVRALTQLRNLFINGTPYYTPRGPDNSDNKSSLADLSAIQGLKLTSLHVAHNRVVDLEPLRGMPLQELDLQFYLGADLTPLQGMPLRYLNLAYSRETLDLTPLAGQPLDFLCLQGVPVADLTPLKNTQLKTLWCGGTQVSDLTPLEEMPLVDLRIDNSKVTDLSLLQGMPLETLWCDIPSVRDAAILRKIKTLKIINEKPTAEFWKDMEQMQAAEQAWLKKVEGLPAEQQIEEVRQELMRRNPGFDGQLRSKHGLKPIVRDGVVIDLRLCTDHVSDISPVRALKGLRVVWFQGSSPESGRLTDLSPLKELALTRVCISQNRQLSDLSPLAGMPITNLSLEYSKVPNLAILKEMPIQALWIYETPIADLSPLAGKSLEVLYCAGSQVKTLQGIPAAEVKRLYCNPAQLPDKAELARLGVTEINGQPVAAFFKDNGNATFRWPADAPPPAIVPFDAEEAQRHQQTWAKYLGVPVEKDVVVGQDKDDKDVALNTVLIPPGRFLMRPGYDVTITRPFRIGTCEVTIAQFQAFVEDSGYKTTAEALGNGQCRGDGANWIASPEFTWRHEKVNLGDDYPVTQLSWNDTLQFCKWLSRKKDKRYRLPTDAEWEWACRAGSLKKYCFGDDPRELGDYAWFADNSGGHTHPVGLKKPNAWGLFDVHGNVAEHCLDWAGGPLPSGRASDPRGPTSGKFRMIRGNSYFHTSAGDVRGNLVPFMSLEHVGMRIVCEVDEIDAGKVMVGAAFTDADVQRIAALPAAEQIDHVRKELIRRNPGFDGEVEHKVQDGVVTDISFCTDHVRDISPLRALRGLRAVHLKGSTPESGRLSDLSPLKGMALDDIGLSWNPPLTDLSPLEGMPIVYLGLEHTNVGDIAVLKDAPLTGLWIYKNPIADLSPLAGKSLEVLWCGQLKVKTLQGLPAAKVEKLVCDDLAMLPDKAELKRLGVKDINGKPVAEFWKDVEAETSSAKPPLDEAASETPRNFPQPAIAAKQIASRAVAEKPSAD